MDWRLIEGDRKFLYLPARKKRSRLGTSVSVSHFQQDVRLPQSIYSNGKLKVIEVLIQESWNLLQPQLEKIILDNNNKGQEGDDDDNKDKFNSVLRGEAKKQQLPKSLSSVFSRMPGINESIQYRDANALFAVEDLVTTSTMAGLIISFIKFHPQKVAFLLQSIDGRGAWKWIVITAQDLQTPEKKKIYLWNTTTWLPGATNSFSSVVRKFKNLVRKTTAQDPSSKLFLNGWYKLDFRALTTLNSIQLPYPALKLFKTQHRDLNCMISDEYAAAIQKCYKKETNKYKNT